MNDGIDTSDQIRIGLSACLAGDEVRGNGGHCRQHYLTDTLGVFFDYVKVCPEVEVGMGVPRPAVRLTADGERIRVVDPKNGVDWTAAMTTHAVRRAGVVAEENLSGFILKSKSPSCGVARVKVYDHNGVPSPRGRGVFADELVRRYPWLPIEEEGRLNDPVLRENFIERVFAYHRLRTAFSDGWKVADIVEFHTSEKLLLRTHDEATYGELGRLVAGAAAQPRPAFSAAYQQMFMNAMARPASVGRHVNVLQHMLGYLRHTGDEPARREARGAVEDYGNGYVPLIAPITLFRYLSVRYDIEYLLRQSYLQPHPKELMLRNHV